MKDQHALISAAITSLFALGIAVSSVSASAADEEKCFGIAKAGQNACNSNANQHSCAGHSKTDNDPNDQMLVPKGSCLKMGGQLAPAAKSHKPAASEKE